MKMTYIARIQANIKRNQMVHTRRAASQVLDGSYKSIFKGRSMNFDELREYVQGDDIKDIDWKASARSQKMLVRQYIADRKHNIMLVFDTNRRMLGTSDGLEEKRELAIMAAGTLAYFVNKSGDYVASSFISENEVKYFPFKSGLGNIELILENYYRAVSFDNDSDVNKTLEYVVKNFRRKMIVLVATDIHGINNIPESTLKRLLIAHDVLFLNMSDAVPTEINAYNLDRNKVFPTFITKNKKMSQLIKQKNLDMIKRANDKLKKYGISCSTIDYTKEIDKEIIDLLSKHKHEKRN